MRINHKSIAWIFTTALLWTGILFAEPADRLQTYTLENGLNVYLLEDRSDALVHINFLCRAGFSSQTQNSCGFFKLFSRLIQKNTPEINFTEVQCNSDSTKFSADVTPQQINGTLESMAQAFFSPAFSDELINTELTKLKSEVTDNSETLSTYINAAIDSRVFSDAPWKNDSGIYPPLFKKTSLKNARTIIQDISDRWYIPKNSTIFIHGNFNSEKILITLKQTFGRFYSNYQTPVEKPLLPMNHQRKYVFHHPDISTELTQIVVQYTMMNMEECDLLAATLNNDASTFKQQTLTLQELNIPGAEYIDVSSAHKRDCSRLIIQTLLQPPENKKLGITSIEQTQDFLNQIYKIDTLVDTVELEFAKKQLEFNMNNILSSPAKLMNNLSSYWAFEPYIQNYESENELYPESPLFSSLLAQSNRINNIDLQTLSEKLNSESPFVFVIINSKDYKKNKNAYRDAGFEEINSDNSSWYVQSMYKEIRDQFKPEETSNYVRSKNINDNAYYQQNRSEIKVKELENGIQIVSKKNDNSKGLSLLISIKGGKLNSADNNGFEEVIINLLAGIIEKEISKKQYQGIITGYANISTQTDISTSSILIEFEKEDALAVFEAISHSIIYGEIAPAAADKAVSARQYKKRLENGSAINQLLYGAVKNLYGKTDIPKIFDSDKDVLQNTDYNSIIAEYPALLDANRYTAIITGDFDENTLSDLENSLSVLNVTNQKLNIPENIPEISKNKSISVKVRHTFLTDVPAEKAGPQPAVLIPTTEFLDPVIYITKSPQPGTKESALFNAMLNYIGQELQRM